MVIAFLSKETTFSRFIPIIWIVNIIKKQYAAKVIDSIQMDMLLKQVYINQK